MLLCILVSYCLLDCTVNGVLTLLYSQSVAYRVQCCTVHQYCAPCHCCSLCHCCTACLCCSLCHCCTACHCCSLCHCCTACLCCSLCHRCIIPPSFCCQSMPRVYQQRSDILAELHTLEGLGHHSVLRPRCFGGSVSDTIAGRKKGWSRFGGCQHLSSLGLKIAASL